MPTPDSYNAILDKISKDYGKDNYPDNIYNRDADADRILDFIRKRKGHEKDFPYTINPFSKKPFNTCVNYAWDAYQAGSKK